MKEIWKRVRHWPYMVSSEGRVTHSGSHPSGRARFADVRKPTRHPKGHLQVTLYRPTPTERLVGVERELREVANPVERRRLSRQRTEHRTFKVHVLVLEAFHGPRRPGQVPAHANGDRTDNRAGNLKWEYPGQPSGAKLTPEQAIMIKVDARPASLVAAEHGVSRRTVSSIRSGQTWSWLFSVRKRRRSRSSTAREAG